MILNMFFLPFYKNKQNISKMFRRLPAKKKDSTRSWIFWIESSLSPSSRGPLIWPWGTCQGTWSLNQGYLGSWDFQKREVNWINMWRPGTLGCTWHVAGYIYAGNVYMNKHKCVTVDCICRFWRGSTTSFYNIRFIDLVRVVRFHTFSM